MKVGMCQRLSEGFYSKDGDKKVNFEDAEEISVKTWRLFGFSKGGRNQTQPLNVGWSN